MVMDKSSIVCFYTILGPNVMKILLFFMNLIKSTKEAVNSFSIFFKNVESQSVNTQCALSRFVKRMQIDF